MIPEENQKQESIKPQSILGAYKPLKRKGNDTFLKKLEAEDVKPQKQRTTIYAPTASSTNHQHFQSFIIKTQHHRRYSTLANLKNKCKKDP